MILLTGALLALALAWALGARPSLLAGVRFRGDALVFAALGVQLTIFTSFAERVPAGLHAPLHLATYGLVIAFLALNARRPGLWLVGAGAACNALVITANGGHMPVSLDAWTATGGEAAALLDDGVEDNMTLAGPGTRLGWLGDVFPLPREVPLANHLSIGDLLLVLGMAVFVLRSCLPPAAARRTAPAVRGAASVVLTAALAATAGVAGVAAAATPGLVGSSAIAFSGAAAATLVGGLAGGRMLALAVPAAAVPRRSLPLAALAGAGALAALPAVDASSTALLLVALAGGAAGCAGAVHDALTRARAGRAPAVALVAGAALGGLAGAAGAAPFAVAAGAVACAVVAAACALALAPRPLRAAAAPRIYSRPAGL